MKFKLLLGIAINLFLLNISMAQFSSIYQAEHHVIGVWESIVQEPENDSWFSISIDPELQKSKLILQPDHTGQIIPSRMVNEQQKPISCTWQIRKTGPGEYYLEVVQGKGFSLIWNYYFEDYDYIVNAFRVKYQKVGN